jgi:hypothetical protein
MKKIIALSMMTMMATSVMAFHGAGSDCSRCHIPHMAADNSGVPLWNGAQAITYDTFTSYYDGFKMDATVGTSPEGSTLLCLSCHDGGSHHPMTSVQGAMAGTHPIEFVYNSALATTDGELKDPETTPSGVVNSSKTIAQDLLTPDTHVLNCVSCHDIHVQGLESYTIDGVDGNGAAFSLTEDIPHLQNIPGIQFQLRYGGTAGVEADYELNYSALCTTCHVK